jgi:glutamate synthase domain-containing protein 3
VDQVAGGRRTGQSGADGATGADAIGGTGRPSSAAQDREVTITYDARGLVELDGTVPKVAEIDGNRAVLDARELSTRKINAELKWLLYEQGVEEVTILNPSARHSLGVGILTRCRMTFEGSLGYFGCGLIDGPEVQVNGRVGWSVAENMMSGVVVVESNAGSLAGAALRGGDLVVKGRVGARTGIDQKGGTIIVLGSAGSMTGFMMQRGRQIICGDVGPGLGDSMYDGTIYVGGKIASLGVDCVEGEWTDADTELVQRKFRIYGLGSPPELRKFVCGKKLYNYDVLEPSERKLVL